MALLDRLENIGPITDVQTGMTLSSQQFRSAIADRSTLLKNQGVQAGQKVLLPECNTISFFVELFSAWHLNACAIPIDAKIPIESMDKFKNQISMADINLLLFTSGSTAQPKAVAHSLETIENRIVAMTENIPLNDITHTLCILPTNFGHGLIGNCLFPLLNGQHLFIAPPFNLAGLYSLAKLIDEHQISFLSSVPAVWRLLKDQSGPKLNSLKRIHCASAPFTDGLFNQIKNWAPSAKVFNVFGTTELASWVSGHEITSTQDESYVGTGWNTEIKLVDVDSTGQGRVWVRSDALMKKYLSNPAETEAVIQNGWLSTNDFGTWTEPFGLRLCGRTDDIINKAGIKIQPLAVEEILNEYPDVLSSCVFSIPHEITGEGVAAALVLKNNLNIESYIIENWCRERMAAYQIPTSWFILNDIPRNERGKIDRKTLRDFCLKLEKPS